MINKKYILNVIGILLVLESLFMLAPIVVSIIYKEKEVIYFAISSVITLVCGGLLWNYTKGTSQDIEQREGFILVSTIWIIYGIFAAMPFYFSGYIPNITDAFFETISGFTSTGATILKNVEILPHCLLFWRSMTHFIGGIGILVLFIVILPIFGTGCMALYRAETSSASQSKLHPRIKETAKRLLWIYISFTIFEIILLAIAGMPIFDAVCHSFGTMASGSFSTKNASMGAFNPYCQYIVMAFMFFAGTNFNLHYFALKGAFRKIFRDNEWQLYIAIILFAGIIITVSLAVIQKLSFENSFRIGFFQVISFLTGTGLTTVNFMQWAPFMWFMLLLLMFIGGCAGSTSGSMKIVRYHLLMKNIFVQFKKIIHERGMFHVRLNDNIVSEDLLHRTLAFFFIYLFTWGLSSFLLMFLGTEPISSMGIVASCMGNVGPGLGSTMSNCADLHVAAKWILSFDMLLGRLELFSIIILFTPYFWKARY